MLTLSLESLRHSMSLILFFYDNLHNTIEKPIILNMSTEFPAEFRETEPLPRSVPMFALEGMNGCGKSHAAALIVDQLRSDNFRVLENKISGMEDGSRVDCLKKINENRRELLKDGNASEKVRQDKDKDRIFRLAMRYQVTQMVRKLAINEKDLDLGILDRTPMMPWAFSASYDPSSPFLDEILEDGLKTTKQIGINTIYILDIDSEIAFARVIARVCVGHEDATSRVEQLCQEMEGTPESKERVLQKTLELIQKNPNLLPREFDTHHLIPLELMQAEHDKLIEAVQILHKEQGIRYVIVNAEKDIHEVVEDIHTDILNQLRKV